MAAIKNAIDLILQAAANRVIGPPSNAPVPTNITIDYPQGGGQNITLQWSYAQGAIKADTIGILWTKSANGVPRVPTVSDFDGFDTQPVSAIGRYQFPTIDTENSYRASVVAGQLYEGRYLTGPVIAPLSAPDWHVEPTAPKLGGQTVASILANIDTALANTNPGNDSNYTAIAAPTGLSVTHPANSDGSVDITLNWLWSGNPQDIDGFGVLFRAGLTSGFYLLGQAQDGVEVTLPAARKFIWRGAPATPWYTGGVCAYRRVTPNATYPEGLIISTITQLSAFQPNAAPNITANVGGTAATLLATYAAGAYTGTLLYRSIGAPSTLPSPINATVVNNSVGGRDVTLTWGQYNQGTLPADYLVIFYRKGSGTVTYTDAAIVCNVNTAGSSFFIFPNVLASDAYVAGIAACRATSNGIEIGAIVQPASWSVSAGTVNNTATAAPWSVVSSKPSNIAALNGSEQINNALVSLSSLGFTGDPAATRNVSTQGAFNPSGGISGDSHYNTATGVLWINVAGVWVSSADKTSVNTAASIAGQGAFATQNQISLGNVSSLVAAGALGDAQLASLAASKILAGTLAAGVAYIGSINANQVSAGTFSGVNIDLTGSARFNGTYTIGGQQAAMVVNDSGNRQIGINTRGSIAGVLGTTTAAGGGSGLSGTASGVSNNGVSGSGFGGAVGVNATSSGSGEALYAQAFGGKAAYLGGTAIGDGLHNFNDGITFNSGNKFRMYWQGDSGSNAVVIGKTHTAWLRFYVDSTLFYLPLFQ